MGPKQVEGLIEIALGVILALMAAGIIPISKNPEAGAAWRRKYKWGLGIGSLLCLLYGTISFLGGPG